MKTEKIILNGNWNMGYVSNEPYNSEDVPKVEYFHFKNAVPGYWEDMMDAFRGCGLHVKLSYNPSYTLQRYPQVAYVPDMALPTILGCFAYSKSFELMSDEVDTEAYIYCGGAHNTTRVWINGQFIGMHRGYSSEFTIDIPRGVLVEGINNIVLTVSNNLQGGYMDRPVSGCSSRAANECTGGIYGDLELRFAPDGLRNVRVSTSKECDCFTVYAEGGLKADVTVKVFDGDIAVREGVIAANEGFVTFSTEGMKLWSPDDPYRYTVVLTTENQSVSRIFGLRRLLSKGMKLYLNGEPFMFRGICEHGYYPVTVHPSRDKNYYRASLRKLKELGFNAVRFHTWVPVEEYMIAADELGMLIEVETPNNTTYEEWRDIVKYTARYTSVIMYSSGNEMVIDEDYIEHLRACAELVHTMSDSLFSPMSAMRGIEYVLSGNVVDKPFPHNPERLAVISEFCDAYNTYSRGATSYRSVGGDAHTLENDNKIYNRPLLSHEICINGTYIDLSLEERYRGTRIGDTELYSSVRRHLDDKGLLDRAPKYYINSVEWQRRIRKHCFERCRIVENFAGYDFLGDIDHHWHTFGYCVGMMNEFYELKPTETVENVLRYNNDAVLLCDLPKCVNFNSGDKADLPILVSNYGETIEKATVSVRISGEKKVYLRREIKVGEIKRGELKELCHISLTMPKVEKPEALKLVATLGGGNTDINNEWELYLFPKVKANPPSKKAQRAAGVIFADDMTKDELIKNLAAGKSVVLLSAGPFARYDNSFQISIAGRTHGHLATVITDTPFMRDFPHSGFCSWQFFDMMMESHTAGLDLPSAEFAPIIEVASSYKNARREAMMFEYRVGDGKLFVSTLNLKESDPAATWLKARIAEYAMSDEFEPKVSLTFDELGYLTSLESEKSSGNANNAQNMNDITMRQIKIKR